MFLPYLIVGLSSLLVSAFISITCCVLLFLYTTTAVGLFVMGTCFVFLSIAFYFWHVVLSHYYEVKQSVDVDRQDTL